MCTLSPELNLYFLPGERDLEERDEEREEEREPGAGLGDGDRDPARPTDGTGDEDRGEYAGTSRFLGLGRAGPAVLCSSSARA